MIQGSLAAAIVAFVVLGGVVLKECVFLAPLRWQIWQDFGEWLLWFSLALVLNVVAGMYVILRTLALKNTGDKLTHLEKQLRGRETVSEELTERILQRK